MPHMAVTPEALTALRPNGLGGRSFQRAPDALRRGGAGDIGDAERRQGVGNGVGDGREGGDGAGFTAASDAERVGRAARAVEGEVV
jgi:hypothetical protein